MGASKGFVPSIPQEVEIQPEYDYHLRAPLEPGHYLGRVLRMDPRASRKGTPYTWVRTRLDNGRLMFASASWDAHRILLPGDILLLTVILVEFEGVAWNRVKTFYRQPQPQHEVY